MSFASNTYRSRFLVGALALAIAALVGVAFVFIARPAPADEPDEPPAPTSSREEAARRVQERADAAATNREPYRAVGGPKDPKVPVRWNRFYDYAEMTEILKKLAAAYPDIVKLESIAKTHGGHDLWVVTITNHQDGVPELHKSAMWIDGGLHPNETQVTEIVLYSIWYLAEMYSISPEIKRMVDERVFYLAPMMNPDSREAHFYQPNNRHKPRGGMRPVDDDGDGLFDEDGFDDLDGDGHITVMRVADENGTHLPHPKFPRLMIEAKPGQKGTYRMVGEEGIDNDGDGEINEDGDGYYDTNRLWPWLWEPEYVQKGGYWYPFSVHEVRVFGDFLMAHPNISGSQNYHNTGGLIVRGPAAAIDKFQKADIAIYDRLAKQGERMLPGYKYISQSNSLYESYGETITWRYQMLGHVSLLNETFAPFNFFGTTDAGYIMPRPIIVHEFDKYLLFDDAFSDWQEIDHPQFGKVEVGGLRKNFGRQPPSFMMEETCHRNMAFTLYHADQMPKVSVQSIDVAQVEGELYQVTAVVENDRIIPTRLAVDVRRNISPPDVVSIERAAAEPAAGEAKQDGAGQAAESGPQADDSFRVITALVSDSAWFPEPRDVKRNPQAVEIATLGGNSVKYVRWLVEGAGPYRVSIKSTKGGRDSQVSE